MEGEKSMNAKHTLKVPKSKDISQMTIEELQETLAKLRNEKLKIDGKNKSPMATPLSHPSGEARQNRKTIARIMTCLASRGAKP
jgi:ribosomal protein L29